MEAVEYGRLTAAVTTSRVHIFSILPVVLILPMEVLLVKIVVSPTLVYIVAFSVSVNVSICDGIGVGVGAGVARCHGRTQHGSRGLCRRPRPGCFWYAGGAVSARGRPSPASSGLMCGMTLTGALSSW